MSMLLVRRTDLARRTMVEIDGLRTADRYVVTLGAYGIWCSEAAPNSGSARVGPSLRLRAPLRPPAPIREAAVLMSSRRIAKRISNARDADTRGRACFNHESALSTADVAAKTTELT